MPSLSEENYLKAIYALNHEENNVASTNLIAERMNTKASSVTVMLKKLKEKELVDYKKYQSTQLTEKGKAVAISIIRKHRLWETFLVNKLNFNWDEVHDIAEQLEHINSIELTNRLEAHLDYPLFDPHGDPIPDKSGNFPERNQSTLNLCTQNQKATIIGVNDHSSEFYNYLQTKGIKIGSMVSIIDVNSFDSSMEINVDGKNQTSISNEVAKNLVIS